LERLIWLGVDVNAVDDAGNTPLHAAAESESVGCWQTLIDHGAVINANNDEDEPMKPSLLRV